MSIRPLEATKSARFASGKTTLSRQRTKTMQGVQIASAFPQPAEISASMGPRTDCRCRMFVRQNHASCQLTCRHPLFGQGQSSAALAPVWRLFGARQADSEFGASSVLFWQTARRRAPAGMGSIAEILKPLVQDRMACGAGGATAKRGRLWGAPRFRLANP